MPTNVINGPKSEQDRFDEQTVKAAIARHEREEGDQNQQEIRAGNLGLDITTNGKTIRRSSNHDNTKHTSNSMLQGIFGSGFAATSSFINEIVSAAAGVFITPEKTTISSSYNARVNPRGLVLPQYDDGEYLYDAIKVSAKAYEKLMAESEEVAQKVALYNAAVGQRDEVLQQNLLKDIEKLSKKYEMRPHPLSGIYVHELTRVLEVEKACGGDLKIATNVVCIYVLKSNGDDLRGIKLMQGDVYNQDPCEAIRTGQKCEPTAP